jgi:serine/threonine-protein kinase
LRPVFQALAFAHERRVAHRDVKPANMMIAGAAGARLLDFGVAKLMNPEDVVGSGETSTRALVTGFSPRYASPEQQADRRTGPWTDVHALGLILTEMLSGGALLTTAKIASRSGGRSRRPNALRPPDAGSTRARGRP